MISDKRLKLAEVLDQTFIEIDKTMFLAFDSFLYDDKYFSSMIDLLFDSN